MCEEAKRLFVGYLDTLEEYDRLHLRLLAAQRSNDPEAMEAYGGLLHEAKLKLEAVRVSFQDHQKLHNCAQAVHLENH
jgi:hypothetical protein